MCKLVPGNGGGCLRARNKAEYAHKDGGTANVDILRENTRQVVSEGEGTSFWPII